MDFHSHLLSCTSLRTGRSLHAILIVLGRSIDVLLATDFINLYSRLGDLPAAALSFNAISTKNIFSWNSMISAYVRHGLLRDAFLCFWRLHAVPDLRKKQGLKPDALTLVSLASAIAQIGDDLQCGAVHGYGLRRLWLEDDIFVGNAIIDMYGKLSRVESSRGVFDMMPNRDIVSWNTLITSYSQNGFANEAIVLYEIMERSMPKTSSGPWNAIIAGHGIHGYGEKALELFSEMQQEGVNPDHVTFVSLLSACSHAGLIEHGQEYFQLMEIKYGIEPLVKHYACIVDLLGRAGKLDEAYKFIEKMPLKPDSGVWGALLAACRIHGDIELGKIASTHIFEIDPVNVGYYVLLSNLYAKDGEWKGVNQVRCMVKQKRLCKTPGWSSIEVNGIINVFFTGNQSHPQYQDIYKELIMLLAKMKNLGYVPDYSFVLQDVEDDEKEQILTSHSERLAIAFGMISTPLKSPLQIFKNLRVCGDCHNATKYISLITDREIIVRDSNRFHHFREGNCSCGDYW
ncbi:Pentatricopeptide repeat-containing protein [Apostasia shenzhenica]|uniref:Pentatricopeptide repeat-containing protein n=1 Tax=Apostasia shenzhenica TaxID=1088818 RepID=A0A2I0AVD6_9ASPA|nr:Pentatricopeptide repeat-containing protein [Apostasia shenzhenica]